LLVIAVLAISRKRGRESFPQAHTTTAPDGKDSRPLFRGLRDALTLRHLHPSGVDCADAEERRRPWRRWFHHCTSYGFALCFASTTVAAVYHLVFGWRAPYGYASLPVVLGTTGGLGLLVGPIGLLALQRSRDRALEDRRER